MTQQQFNLAELIIQITEEVGPDPGKIAARIHELIPEDQRNGVMKRLLVSYVRAHIPRLSQAVSMAVAQAAGRPVRSGRLNRSAKVAAYQEYSALMRATVSTGPGAWKWFGDCTYDDLMYAADNRRTKAAQTLAQAQEFEEWATLLKRHDVTQVSDLPAEVIDAYLASRSQAR